LAVVVTDVYARTRLEHVAATTLLIAEGEDLSWLVDHVANVLRSPSIAPQ